jgi:hypothetical protein
MRAITDLSGEGFDFHLCVRIHGLIALSVACIVWLVLNGKLGWTAFVGLLKKDTSM